MRHGAENLINCLAHADTLSAFAVRCMQRLFYEIHLQTSVTIGLVGLVFYFSYPMISAELQRIRGSLVSAARIIAHKIAEGVCC